jgi:hypothetical protein
MNKIAMIKQAYAYGAAVALQELGYDLNAAQNAGIKLAEDEEGMHPALRALLGTGAGLGALGGAALGAGGAALAQKLSPSRFGRLTNANYMGRVNPEEANLAEKAMGLGRYPEKMKGYYDNASSYTSPMAREALLGAEAGGALGGAGGAIGGGLYGGLSE